MFPGLNENGTQTVTSIGPYEAIFDIYFTGIMPSKTSLRFFFKEVFVNRRFIVTYDSQTTD